MKNGMDEWAENNNRNFSGPPSQLVAEGHTHSPEHLNKNDQNKNLTIVCGKTVGKLST